MNDAQDDLDLDVDAIRKVWRFCTVCRQYFNGEVLTKLAKEFAVITSNEYSDHHGLKMEALRFKCAASVALIGTGESIDDVAKDLHDLFEATESNIS